jgi:ribonuclease P protein component
MIGVAAQSRIGIVVPKHGQTAVRRNRLKRQLREGARLGLLPSLEGTAVQAVDVVIRARREAYDAPAATLRRELEKMASSIVRFAAKDA